MKISVVVTSWNGLALLQKNFEKIVMASPEAQEIIFSDDASTDSSVQFISGLQKKYSKIRIIAHQKNLGFGKNTNIAVQKAKGDFVVLLNNDIFPESDYIKNSLIHFQDKSVFGVGFAEKGHENWARIFWKNGYLQHEPGKEISKTHITAWVSGGSSIIRKSIFIKLGGFDEIYAPFYSEDLDLGFRAWKSGYKLLWEPKSIVKHNHESTMSKFPKKFLDYVKERNRLLTVWRNISSADLIRQNRMAIIGRIILGPNYIKIARAAKKQIRKFPPPIVFPKLSDQEVLNLFK